MKTKLRKEVIALLIAAIILIILIITFLYMQAGEITIEGNTRYTEEEMRDFIFDTKLDENVIVAWVKNKLGYSVEIPFIEKYDVEIKSFDKINVVVYEKSIMGYIDYMGTYMYFDKDGIVVESSEEKISGVPRITGIDFDYILLHEPLPVENKEVFDLLLTVTQTLKKYELTVKKIYISDNLEISVYKKDVRVDLGTEKDLSEKISVLSDMASKLDGYSGTLDMKELDPDGNYTLKSDVNLREDKKINFSH